jgi:hypothetical protein
VFNATQKLLTQSKSISFVHLQVLFICAKVFKIVSGQDLNPEGWLSAVEFNHKPSYKPCDLFKFECPDWLKYSLYLVWSFLDENTV